MAVRTSSAAVAAIIEVDDSIDLAPFIETANNVTTNICANPPETFGYSDAQLELIERWLSAHFYAIRDMRVSQENAGSVGQGFQYKLGLILQSTMYGQQAMMLDYQGALAAFSKRLEDGATVKPGIRWLGKECPRGTW